MVGVEGCSSLSSQGYRVEISNLGTHSAFAAEKENSALLKQVRQLEEEVARLKAWEAQGAVRTQANSPVLHKSWLMR